MHPMGAGHIDHGMEEEARQLPKGMKNNDGNKYRTNPNYAEQVIKNNEVQPAQNNPRESDDTMRHR